MRATAMGAAIRLLPKRLQGACRASASLRRSRKLDGPRHVRCSVRDKKESRAGVRSDLLDDSVDAPVNDAGTSDAIVSDDARADDAQSRAPPGALAALRVHLAGVH